MQDLLYADRIDPAADPTEDIDSDSDDSSVSGSLLYHNSGGRQFSYSKPLN
jgi:hypothetical protein